MTKSKIPVLYCVSVCVSVADSIPKSSGGSSDKDGASKLQSDGSVAKSKQSVMEKQVSEKLYSDVAFHFRLLLS